MNINECVNIGCKKNKYINKRRCVTIKFYVYRKPNLSDNNPVKPFLFAFTDIFLVRLGFLLFSNLDKTDGLLGENLTSLASIDEREGRTAEQQDMACNSAL